MGVDTRQRTTSSEVKTVLLTDPDGNHVAVAEATVARAVGKMRRRRTRTVR